MGLKNENSKKLAKNAGSLEQEVLPSALSAAYIAQNIPQNFAAAIAEQSSYLSRLIQKFPDFYSKMLANSPQIVFDGLIAETKNFDIVGAKKTDLMSFLRVKKAQISLLVAAADISNCWNLRQVTGALSEFADLAVLKATEFLWHEAHREKLVANAELGKSGIITLAVGKLGGFELNYSSDIDLIFLYDPERAQYIGRKNVRQFFVSFCTDFVAMLQERTADGYVFRVDLRLRPDPYSTPVAVSVQAARTYYENVGQNWERAAMIKARFVCGDIEAGEDYIKFMASFVWRKYLDFAALNDIHSIKRQIDSSTEYKPEGLLGYNIKVGKGGIREIEFFAQVQQLIWGGRLLDLRQKSTCFALAELEKIGRIKAGATAELTTIYEFYRAIEHRLQMVADEHTHSLPATVEGMAKFAEFLGFVKLADFEAQLQGYLAKVQAYYAQLFVESPSLSAEGNLVFTGVSNDPETLLTLGKLGFQDAEKVCEIIRGWHHGRRRATRFRKVREMLTELTPEILKYFSQTGDPDVAFVKFDAFLATLPSGIQLFTLFNEKPELIELIADIMGDSPWLAENFGRSPALVSRILSSDFHSQFPMREELQHDLRKELEKASEQDGRIKIIRRWKHDMEFQVGIRLLKKIIEFQESAQHFSDIAEIVVEQVLHETFQSMDEQIDGEFVVIAMGKLGARELTFGSDLDLVFVYESKAESASQFYVKLAQKFVATMSSLSEDGMLYKVDTRLRPQGEQGNLACSYSVFERYYQGTAWNWELLALTKARAINKTANLSQKLSEEIREIVLRERDNEKLAQDVLEMRKKIAQNHAQNDGWNLKYAKGGIFELEFIIQYLILVHSQKTPALFDCGIDAFWSKLKANSILPAKHIHELEAAFYFIKKMESVIRLTTKSGLSADKLRQNQRKVICGFFQQKKFEDLEAKLFASEAVVNKNFKLMFG